MQVQKVLITTVLALAGLTSCSHHGHGHGHTAPDEVYFEVEPNGSTFNADYLGEIRAGDYLEIQGHITECCLDIFDGFSFYATEPVSVTITLHELSSGVDFDFGIYIPEIDQFVDAFEGTHNPEIGVFDQAGAGEFHVVVSAFHGSGDYLLQVDVAPLSLGLENGQLATPAALASTRSGMSRQSLERFEPYAQQQRATRQLELEVRILNE